MQFEGWVRDHIPQPDDATKAKWTAEINALQKNEEMAAAEWIECGDPDLTLRGTILLNDMVDWKHMHEDIVSRQVARA